MIKSRDIMKRFVSTAAVREKTGVYTVQYTTSFMASLDGPVTLYYNVAIRIHLTNPQRLTYILYNKPSTLHLSIIMRYNISLWCSVKKNNKKKNIAFTIIEASLSKTKSCLIQFIFIFVPFIGNKAKTWPRRSFTFELRLDDLQISNSRRKK